MSRKKEKDHVYDDGSYVVKKKRKFHIFAFILCLIIAFLIWLSAVQSERKSEEAAEKADTASLYTDVIEAEFPENRVAL